MSPAPHEGQSQPTDTHNIPHGTGERPVDPGPCKSGYGLMGGTEAATAYVFAANATKGFRFAGGLGWLGWDGKRWSRVLREHVQVEMGRIVRSAVANSMAVNWQFADNADWKTWVHRAATRAHLLGAISFAESEMSISINVLDAHPHLLNCRNGTLNLETGDLQPHNPDNYITKLAGANFDASVTSPDVAKWLESFGDINRREFLLRVTGSTLHGANSRDEKLLLLRGDGGTGKGTYLAVAAGVLGEYATSVAPELMTERSRNPTGARPELVELRGARLIYTSETGDDSQFASPLVKALTGRDEISARGNYSNDMIKFVAAGKLFIATNFEPKTNAYDSGMRRRLLVVPFDTVPDGVDATLKSRLREDPTNLTAALNAMLEGCKKWLEDGLKVTDNSVDKATNGYWAAQDVAGSFVNEMLDLASPNAQMSGKDLQVALRGWCDDTGNIFGSRLQGDLSRVLQSRGIKKIAPGGAAKYIGIALRPTDGGNTGPNSNANVGADPAGSKNEKNLSGTYDIQLSDGDVGASGGQNTQNPHIPTRVQGLRKVGVTAPTSTLEVHR
jgi:putative DNA primase/helicase